MSDDRDAYIAAGLRAGRAEAWAALYDTYFEQVWRLAGRMIGPDAQAVADVVQETFLSAAASAAGFDPRRGSLWSWLAGVCRNHVLLHFRRRVRDGRLSAGGDVQAGLAARRDSQAQPPADQAGMLAEQAQTVRAALASLPWEYQSVLTSRYIEDTPVDRIAAQAGCSVEALRSRLARARQAFRRAMGPWPAGGGEDIALGSKQ